MEAHDGELREVQGSWEMHPCPMPTPENDPHLFRCQFANTRHDYLAWQGKGMGRDNPQKSSGMISKILKEPAGGANHFFARKAQIIGLGELFLFFGEMFTAGELYAYFVNARQLTLKRPHAWTSPTRRQQVINHYVLTNKWGLGSQTPVGQPDRREVDA